MSLRVLNCPNDGPRELSFECPRRWEDLDDIGRDRSRHCLECGEFVYACYTTDEEEEHARKGHCVARFHATRSIGRPEGRGGRSRRRS